MTNDVRSAIRNRIRSDQYMPDALNCLRAKELLHISDQLGGIAPRSLVDLRYHLANAFVNQVRTIRGDPIKPNRSVRRDALGRLAQKAKILRREVENNLPWMPAEHNEALFFGASGPAWSPFAYDYAYLIEAIERLEAIAATILSVPPIGKGSTTSPFLPGFPSDRLYNPGTSARVAFARRMGQIYFDLTGKMPGVTKERDGPYQRMTGVASTVFLRAYKKIDEPFGVWRPPGRKDMQEACKNLGRKST